ncbi:MAG: hypothetical protein C0606_01120 [Hyphomicrobiales bacterium]|nr:MAG: hypothetical protein C0606_01120 [Hyphomicrobiales bacterium]
MTQESALAFVLALLLWVVIPGPAIVMIVGRALGAGARHAVPLIAGILAGDVFYMMIVLFGLAAIGQLVGEFFIIVRMLGAAYLIYLGIQLWRRPVSAISAQAGDEKPNGIKSFIAGFGITLGNPKAILFHLGFLPTFFDLSRIGIVDALAIIGLFLAVLGSALVGYALLAGRARALFVEPARLRLVNRSAGALMVGAGVAILAKRQ